MPTGSTSATATRTTGTRTTRTGSGPSADLKLHPADFSFEELVAAYFDCREHKRNTRSALAFEQDLERNLVGLDASLRDGSYAIGPTKVFPIFRPKLREVWAANFPDRIVQHLAYNRLAPRFHARFIADTCACIPGRGTLYACERLESKVRSITQNWSREAYYLKCDIANFFVSIDKGILGELVDEHVHEPWWRELAHLILFHDPRRDPFIVGDPRELARIPPHKSLFHAPAHKGLPIGNLWSQFLANVYLNVLDQFVKHVLRARYYIRYVDDLVVLGDSPEWLHWVREQIEWLLADRLDLRLNARKTVLQPIARGVDFSGQVLKPWRRTIRRHVVSQALRRAAASPELRVTANSYFGLFRQASHSARDRERLAHVALRRGHCVDLALTKTYQRSLALHASGGFTC